MTPTPNARLSLAAALREAVRLWPAMLGGAGGVLAVSAVLGAAGSVPAFQSAVWPLRLAYAVASLVALSAVTRIAVAGGVEAARTSGPVDRGLGLQGFQLGRTELRLAGAVLLLSLFFAIIVSVLGLTALALFGAAGLDVEALKVRDWAGVGPMWKLILLGLIGLGLVAAPMVLAVRVSLFAQATVARGRMTSLGATAVTNGSMAPLFAGLLLIAAPGVIWLGVGATMLMSPVVLGIGWVLIQAIWQVPVTAGFLGAAWRRLDRGDEGLAPL